MDCSLIMHGLRNGQILQTDLVNKTQLTFKVCQLLQRAADALKEVNGIWLYSRE